MEAYWGNIEPAGQTQNTEAQCPMSGILVSRGLDCSAPPALLPSTYIPLLSQYHALYATLLGRCLIALAPSTSWGLHCQLGFIFTISHNGLLASQGLLCTMTAPTTCYVSSVALWNQGGKIDNSFTLAPFKFLKTSPHEWHCQIGLPAWDGLWPFHIHYQKLKYTLVFLGADNSLVKELES